MSDNEQESPRLRVGQEAEHTNESNVAAATQMIGEMLSALKRGERVDTERLDSLDKLSKLSVMLRKEDRDAERGERFDDMLQHLSDEKLNAMLEETLQYQQKKQASG